MISEAGLQGWDIATYHTRTNSIQLIDMSLQNRLQILIKEKGYISRDELRKFGRELNYDEASTDRQCRNLTENRKITPVIRKKYIVGYRHKNDFYEIYSEELDKIQDNGTQTSLL